MATAWGNTPGSDRGEDILVSGLTAAGTYISIGIAVDLDNNTLAAIVTPDSAFNTARSISGVTGAKFPVVGLFNGDIIEANFGASAFEHPVPAGYSAWDSSCTWNPADKDASITLSGSDLIATGTAASAWRAARGTVSHTTGKWYFEVKCRLNTGNGNNMVGVANASAALNTYPNFSANGACYQSNGNFGTNNSFTATTRIWDEYVNNWRTIWADTPHNGGRWYVEVLCNAVSNSNAGIVIGVANPTGRTSQLRTYIGQDAVGNSAGFQSSRAWLRAGGFTLNVVSAALTATNRYCLDIDLDAKTIACRLNGGAWSTPQSIASVVGGPGPATDIYFGISVNDVPSTRDSVTVNFGATAFTHTAPAGANSWDTTFGSTAINVSAEFIEVLNSNDAEVRVGGAIVEAMFPPPLGDVRIGGMFAEVLNTGEPGITASGVIVEVLRNTITNPVYASGIVAEVMHDGTASARFSGMLAEVMHEGEQAVRVSGMIVEVLRISELTGGPGGGASKRNRIISVHSM